MFPAILSKTWWRSLVKGENSAENSEEEEFEALPPEDDDGLDEPLDEAGEDLDDDDALEDEQPAEVPWRGKVDTVRDFFQTEVVYRFDILEPAVQDRLRGRYRVEVKGHEGGTWTLVIGDALQVVNERADAEVVLAVQQREFLQLVNGDLNPQLAILAQKVRLQGDVRQASLFHCLLSPPGHE